MHRVAVTYLVSYALSLLGNSVIAIALPLLVLLRTGSALAAGTLSLAVALPAVLVGIVGGLIIDRYDRRRVSIASDWVSAAAVAAIPLVDVLFGLDLGWFIALGVLGAIGDVPGMTAREALLPAVVRHSGVSAERLMGLRESLGALVIVIGPAMAGGLMVLLEGSLVMWVTAGTSAAAALVSCLLPRDLARMADDEQTSGGPTGQGGLRRAWGQLAEGLDWLFRRDRFVLGVTAITVASAGLMGSMQGLVLPVHFAVLQQPERLGFVLSALAVGLLVGAGLYTVLARRLARRGWFVLSMLGTAAAVAAMAALPPFPGLLAASALLGAASGPLNALLGVLMIERIPDAMRGRVLSSQNSVVMLSMPVAIFICGVLVERWGLPAATWSLAVGWGVAVLFSLLYPAFHELGDPKDAGDPGDPHAEHR